MKSQPLEEIPEVTNNRFYNDKVLSGVDINMPKYQATKLDESR